MSTAERTVNIAAENRIIFVPRQDTKDDRTVRTEERY
jgi:hypothetical protein